MRDRPIYVPVNLLQSIFITAILLVFLQFDVSGDMYCQYRYYGIIAILGYVWIFFSNSKRLSNKINLFLVFIALTIPFYFGGQILILLGYGAKLADERYSLVDGRVGMQYNIAAMKYIIISLRCLNIGYQFRRNNRDSQKKFRNAESTFSADDQSAAINLVATILIIVAAVPTIVRLGYDISVAKAIGHLAYLHEKSEDSYMGIWFAMSYIQGWFLPACYMKLVCGKPKGKRIIYILLAIYMILYLMTGSRYEIIQIAFAIFVINTYTSDKKIRLRDIIIFIVIGYIAIVILRSVSYTRDVTGSGLSLSSIANVLGGNVLYECLFETSTTFTSISNTIMHVPSTIYYNCGKSILGAFNYILPAFLRISPLNNIVLQLSSKLSPLYYGYSGAGYGSSFLTESYFNYGFFSPCIMLFFGYFLNLLTSRLAYFSINNDKRKFIISLYIMTELVWAIRQDMYLIPRHLVYYILIPLVISSLLAKRRKKG